MTKLRFMIFISVGLAVSPVIAKQFHPLDDIKTLAEQTAHEMYPEKNTKITASQLDPRLRLAQCNKPLQAEPPNGISSAGNLTIGIRCNGSEPWFIYIPVSIQVFRQVVIAQENLHVGDKLDGHNLALKQLDIHGLSGAYLTSIEKITGMQVVQPVRAGMMVYQHMLKKPIVIKRGQAVRVIARNPAFQVQIEATALSAGAVGDRIKLENKRSQRIIEGIISSDKQVYIN